MQRKYDIVFWSFCSSVIDCKDMQCQLFTCLLVYLYNLSEWKNLCAYHTYYTFLTWRLLQNIIVIKLANISTYFIFYILMDLIHKSSQCTCLLPHQYSIISLVSIRLQCARKIFNGSLFGGLRIIEKKYLSVLTLMWTFQLTQLVFNGNI